MKRLNICIVSQQVRDVFSGPGLYTHLLMDSLIHQGHQLTVLSTERQKPEDTSAFRFVGITPQFVPNNLARWVPLSLAFRDALHQLEKDERYDIIHFTDFRDGLFCSPKATTVANINDTYSIESMGLAYYRKHYFDGPKRWLFYRLSQSLERARIPKLQHLIANSRYTKQVYSQNYPFLNNRLALIYKSVDVDRYKAIAGQRQFRLSSTPHILFVGGNMQRKGVPNILKAAAIANRKFPNCRYEFVGIDAAIPRLMHISRTLGISEQINFVGHQNQNELLAHYTRADIFLMPSLTEAFGVAILEAMAAAVPVIASRTGGIPEIVNDGANGALVAPGCPEELAETIMELIANPEKRESFSRNGLVTARQFSSERMIVETMKLYEEIL